MNGIKEHPAAVQKPPQRVCRRREDMVEAFGHPCGGGGSRHRKVGGIFLRASSIKLEVCASRVGTSEGLQHSRFRLSVQERLWS